MRAYLLLLRLFPAFLLRQADQHGVRFAEGLQRNLSEADIAQACAQIGQVRRLRRAKRTSENRSSASSCEQDGICGPTRA